MPLKRQFPCGKQHNRNKNIGREFQKALGGHQDKESKFFSALKKISVLNLSEVRAKKRNAVPKT